jgi:hypothetical protein
VPGSLVGDAKEADHAPVKGHPLCPRQRLSMTLAIVRHPHHLALNDGLLKVNQTSAQNQAVAHRNGTPGRPWA